MKRSESVLIYGVTGVLAVILAVAVIFGEPDPRTTKQGDGDQLAVNPAGPPPADGSVPSTSELDSDEFLQELLSSNVVNEEPSEVADPAPTSEPSVEDASAAVKSIGAMVPLRTVADLGRHRTVRNPASGDRFRFVTVQRGDTLSDLIQRWCPGADPAEIAALNETLDLDRLRYDTELCLPWIDDAALLDALAQRELAAKDRSSAPAATEASLGRGTTEYTVAEGESLWVIAERHVGARKAQEFIDAVLELNSSIEDAGRIRSGQKLLIPAKR